MGGIGGDGEGIEVKFFGGRGEGKVDVLAGFAVGECGG